MSAKRSPRAMPVETIITRFKSRNQQFVKERHKKVTKPISPKSKSISKPLKQHVGEWKEMKSSKNVQKRSVKVNDVGSREFYPDKPKRNIEYKKVVLMPKHCMKMIGGTKSCNKRKLHTPRKEIKRTRRDSNSSMLSDIELKSPENKDQDEELTIKDMVLLIEEQGGLNDEDLLEILTCPSPVWWEDPPDGYIEEPIFARPKPVEQKSVKNQLLEEQNKEAERRKLRDDETTLKGIDTENLDVSKLGISVENRGKIFMNKRYKLESLLGSIRNKIKGGDDSFKKEANQIISHIKVTGLTDDLNASNYGKKYNKSQSMVSILKQIKETVNDESNTKIIEKCDTQVNYDKNLNQTVELEPINTDQCQNITNNELKLIFKAKKIKNRNRKRKVENKSKKRISALKLKEVVTLSENLDSNVFKNINVQSSKSDKNHEHIATSNREKRSSESFEDLLDLDDQEILSLENMEIPIANVKVTNPPVNRQDTTDNQVTPNNSSAKINYDNSGKEIKFIETENSANKFKKSTKTTKYIDNDAPNSKIEQEKSKNRVKEIDKETKNKLSYIRVKNIGTLTNSNTSCTSDAILGETLSANDKIKKPTTSKNYKDSRSFMKNVNNRLRDNTPIILPEEDCIQIKDDDFNNRKSETKHTSVKIDSFTDNDPTSIQFKNKITEYHYHEGKNDVYNSRRYSIDSATSDKNMSVEYLDMSLLDEDERKIELESQNNEYNYECNDYESQSNSQTCNRNNHINFKSDLDMTDSNMYDQINESCNSDIIKYIRDNQKNMDTIQDEDFNIIGNTLRSSSAIQENALSDKLTPGKDNLNINKKTEYFTVYKVINSDSENECNLGKIVVKNDALNEKNEVNKLNEIKKGSFMENNAIDNSELIAYEEEYLTEFDEMTIVGNEKGNVIKIGEVDNATINQFNDVKLQSSKKSNEMITKIVNNQGSLIKTVEENAVEGNNKEDLTKINDIPDSVEDAFKNQVNLNNADPSKVTDKSNKHINNYYKHRKDIRKANKNNEIISNNKSKKENHENVIETKKIECKLCNFKNRSISLSENNSVKYCLLCSSIYDTENCKYCIKELKCSCKNNNQKYVCDKCNLKLGDKQAIIEHLKINCNMVTHT